MATAACALALSTASQSAVLYKFEWLDLITPGVLGSFEYVTPTYMTTNQILAASDLTSCGFYSPPAACADHEIWVDTTGLTPDPGDTYDAIAFMKVTSLGSTGKYHYFANGAFGAVGTYDEVLPGPGEARLTVSIVPDPPTIPEPTTWALMLLGFGAAGAALRRRRAAA